MIEAKQAWPSEFADRYERAGYWRGETFGHFLRERASQFPHHLAVVGGDLRMTYAELDAEANRIASGMLALGIERGERVVVHLPNIPEFISVVFGLFRAGIVPVFALPAHRSAEIVHFAQASEAVGYIIADQHEHDGFDYRDIAQAVADTVPTIKHVIVAGDAGEFVPLSSFVDATPPLHGPSPSDVAFMQLSGGSTGLSKLIPRTHDDYIYSVRRSAEICELGPQSVYMGTLPIAHNFPMSSPGFLGTLYAGGTVVLCLSPSPDVAFPLIERERVTITGVVPPVALVWLDAAEKTTHDLSSLSVLQVGGAKLIPEVARRIQPTLGARLQQVFGMAEGLVNYTRLDDPDDIVINTQGKPMCPDDEVLVVDDAGNSVPVGTPGYLLTRGPYTIRAYHNAPEANAKAFTDDGFYRTGDIVIQNEQGYLTVMGRATDQINRGGEKVSAEEIEDHLLAHPNVHDAVVVSVDDSYLGERSCAFVIPRGDKPKAAVIRSWIRSRGLAAYKVPDQVVFVETFPSTGVGKISRKDLRAALRHHMKTADTETVGNA